MFQALSGKGAPDPTIIGSDIPIDSLPHCKKETCGGLLRPYIIFFGEGLEPAALEKTGKKIIYLQ